MACLGMDFKGQMLLFQTQKKPKEPFGVIFIKRK